MAAPAAVKANWTPLRVPGKNVAAHTGMLAGAQLDLQPIRQTFPWVNDGWEIQPPQPPKQPLARVAAAGLPYLTQDFQPPAQLRPWLFQGWEVQPPILNRQTSFHPSGAFSGLSVDLVSPAAIAQAVPLGWEIQPPILNRQTSFHPSGAFAGLKADLVPPAAAVMVAPFGWENQPPQPSKRPLPNVAAAVLPYQTQDFQPPAQLQQWLFQGEEVQPPQPPKWPRPSSAAAALQFLALDIQPLAQLAAGWVNVGEEIQPVQPPRPRAFMPGAILKGDEGIQGPILIPLTVGWDPILPSPPRPSWSRSAAFLQYLSVDLLPLQIAQQLPAWAWEAILPQHLAARSRFGHFITTPRMPGISTTPFVVPAAPWFETILPVLKITKPNWDGLQQHLISGYPTTFVPWQWEIQSVQPPQPTWHRTGSIARGHEGIEQVLMHPTVLLNWGQEAIWPQPPRPQWWRAAALLQYLSLDLQPTGQLQWVVDGWEIQPFQPPKLQAAYRAALLQYLSEDLVPLAQSNPTIALNWGFEAALPTSLPSHIGTARWAALGAFTGITDWSRPTVLPPPKPAQVIRGYPAVPLWQPSSMQTWVARIGDVLAKARQGKMNVTLSVTLATGATSTTVTDVRISATCGLVLVPITADAVAIQGSVYVSSQKSGSAVLTHSSTANTDCNFIMVIVG